VVELTAASLAAHQPPARSRPAGRELRDSV